MTTTWTWRKSSRSAGAGACVEVGTSSGTPLIAVRDSKRGAGSPMLVFGSGGIRAFLSGARAGKFDRRP